MTFSRRLISNTPRLLAALLLAAAGCSVSESGKIPCQDDSSCPRDYPSCQGGFCAEAGTNTSPGSPTVSVVGVDGKAASAPLRDKVVVQVAAKSPSGVKSIALTGGGKTFQPRAGQAGPNYAFDLDTTQLADGTVALTATATPGDAAASATTSAAFSIVVDNTPPVLSATAVSTPNARAGSSVTLDVTSNEALATLSGTLQSGATVVSAIGLAKSADGNVYRASIPISASLAAGDYDLVFAATDVAGNAKSMTVAAAFHVHAPFQLAALSPVVRNASSGGAITFNGAPAGNAGSTISIALPVPTGVVLAAGATPAATFTPKGGTARAMTVTGTAPAFTASYQLQAGDADGLGTVDASLLDVAGNASAVAAQVLVKNSKPAVNGGGTGITLSSAIAGPNQPLTILFSTTEVPSSMSVQVNGHAASCASAGTSFSCSYTPTTGAGSDLPTPQVLANVPVAISLTDSIGNSASSQTSLTFDNQPPTFAVGTLSPTQFPSPGTPVTLDVTTSKPTSSFSAVVRLSALPFTVLGSFTEQQGSPVGNLHHLTFAVPNSLTPASYTVAINARDLALNVASESTLTLTVQAPLALSGFTIVGSSVTQSGLRVFKAGAVGSLQVSVNVPQGASLAPPSCAPTPCTPRPNPLFIFTDSQGHQRDLPASTLSGSSGNNNVYLVNANVLVPAGAGTGDQDGVASISVIATAINGAQSTPLSGNLIVDNSGPVFPASGAGAVKIAPSPLRRSQTLTLTATANEPLKTGVGQITVTEVPSTGASYDCALDPVTNRTVTCTAGVTDNNSETVNVTLHVNDLVGNASDASSNATGSYAVDNLTPSFSVSPLAVVSPASATVRVGQQVTISGTTNKPVVNASVTTNRGDSGACSIDVPRTGVTCIISVGDTSTESETATVTLTDAVGNISPGANARSAYQVQYSIDNTPPAFSGASVASNTLKSGQNTTLSITSSKFLAASGTRVVLTTGSQSASFNATSCTSTGTPTCSFDVSQAALAGSSSPGLTFILGSVTMTDTVGNTATVAQSAPAIYVDTVAPSFAAASFLPTVIGGNGVSVLTITATSPESLVASFGASNTQAVLNNGTSNIGAVNASSCSGTTCTFSFSQGASLPDGTYSIASVQLVDQAGNVVSIPNPAGSVTLNVSGAGPAVPGFGAFSPAIVGAGGSVTVTMSVNKPLDATGTSLRIDTATGTQVSPSACTNQPGSNTCSFTISQTALGATGTHTIAKVTQKDLAGNITSFTSGFGTPSVQVDANTPAFSSIGSFAPGTVNGGAATSTQIVVTGGSNGSDGTGGKPQKSLTNASKLVVSGITFGSPSCTGLACTFTIPGASLPASSGSTFTATGATLVDEAGNSTSFAIPATQPTFRLDNIAPVYNSSVSGFSGLTNPGQGLTNGAVTLTVTADKPLATATTAALSVSGATPPVLPTPVCNGNSCTFTIATSGLTTGKTYSLSSVTLQDLDGNSSSPTLISPPSFTFDSSGPTYASSSFSGTAVPLKAGASTTLTITANKAITTASTATIAAGSQSLTLSPTSCNAGLKTCSFAVAVNALVSTPTPLTAYTLTAVTLVDQATNSTSNGSPASPATFSLDTAAPVVATAGFDKSLLKTGTVTLSVTAVNAPESLDTSGTASKTSAVLTNASAAASPLTIPLTCTGVSCTGSAIVGGNLGAAAAGDGTWTLTSILLTDTATNGSTTSTGLSASFTVDTTGATKPTLAAWSPAVVPAAGTVSMTVNMNEPLQTAVMTLTATNGGTNNYKLAGVCSSGSGNPCVFSYAQGSNPIANGNGAAANDGTYTVSSLVLTDLAGNAVTHGSFTSPPAFTIDSAGPGIAVSGNSITGGPVNATQPVTLVLNVTTNVGQPLTAASATLSPQTAGVGDPVSATATVPCTTSCTFTFNSATNGTLFTNSGTAAVSYKLTSVTLSDGTTANTITGSAPNLAVSFDNVAPLLDTTGTGIRFTNPTAANNFAVKGNAQAVLQVVSSNKNLGTATTATLVGGSSTGGTIAAPLDPAVVTNPSCSAKTCTFTFKMPNSGVSSDTIFHVGATLVDTAGNSSTVAVPSSVFVLYDNLGPTVSLTSSNLAVGSGPALVGPNGSPNTVAAGSGNSMSLVFAVADETAGSGVKAAQTPGSIKVGTDCNGGGGTTVAYNTGSFGYATYSFTGTETGASSGFICVDVPAGTFLDNAGNGNLAINGRFKIPVDFAAPSLTAGGASVGSVVRIAGAGSTISGRVQLRQANGVTSVNLYDASGTTALTGCTPASVSTSSTSATLVGFTISCADTASFTVVGNAITNRVKAVDANNFASSAVGTAGRDFTIGYNTFAAGNRTDAFGLLDNTSSNLPALNPAALPVTTIDIKSTVNAGVVQQTGVWQQITPLGTAPTARIRSAAAFDSVNRQLVVVGGVGAGGVPATDGNTFLLDMTAGSPTWTPVANFPSGTGCDAGNRWDAAMATSNNKLFVLRGGECEGSIGAPGSQLFDQTEYWAFNIDPANSGRTWTKITGGSGGQINNSPLTNPGLQGAMVFDGTSFINFGAFQLNTSTPAYPVESVSVITGAANNLFTASSYTTTTTAVPSRYGIIGAAGLSGLTSSHGTFIGGLSAPATATAEADAWSGSAIASQTASGFTARAYAGSATQNVAGTTQSTLVFGGIPQACECGTTPGVACGTNIPAGSPVAGAACTTAGAGGLNELWEATGSGTTITWAPVATSGARPITAAEGGASYHAFVDAPASGLAGYYVYRPLTQTLDVLPLYTTPRVVLAFDVSGIIDPTVSSGLTLSLVTSGNGAMSGVSVQGWNGSSWVTLSSQSTSPVSVAVPVNSPASYVVDGAGAYTTRKMMFFQVVPFALTGASQFSTRTLTVSQASLNYFGQ